ncbi:DUF4190 domain-containing protein [Nocardioides sp.]|uniref:DUF4190 domain-containing protein n=1 Tax=Nocardioides sp. TaxID=35761 RepID=UPI003D126D78
MSYGTPPPGGGYGQQPYGAPAPQHPSATTALILGILSFVLCGPFTGVPAYFVGKRAEREIAASNGTLSGDGMAKAGWILGLVSIILTVLSLIALVVIVIVVAVASSSNA